MVQSITESLANVNIFLTFSSAEAIFNDSYARPRLKQIKSV